MNLEDSPLKDEPELEARIVAWVLGEVSDFERAELARIAAQRPEVAAFRAQMEAMHGLLGDAHKGAGDWKLSAERRTELVQQLGLCQIPESTESIPVLAPTPRRRRWALRSGLGAAAAVVLGWVAVCVHDSVSRHAALSSAGIADPVMRRQNWVDRILFSEREETADYVASADAAPEPIPSADDERSGLIAGNDIDPLLYQRSKELPKPSEPPTASQISPGSFADSGTTAARESSRIAQNQRPAESQLGFENGAANTGTPAPSAPLPPAVTALEVRADGTMTLSASSTYTGGTSTSDGTLAMSRGGAANREALGNSPQDDGASPIIGRVHTWTDDESTKVNIDTASERSFWDQPRDPAKLAKKDADAESGRQTSGSGSTPSAGPQSSTLPMSEHIPVNGRLFAARDESVVREVHTEPGSLPIAESGGQTAASASASSPKNSKVPTPGDMPVTDRLFASTDKTDIQVIREFDGTVNYGAPIQQNAEELRKQPNMINKPIFKTEDGERAESGSLPVTAGNRSGSFPITPQTVDKLLADKKAPAEEKQLAEGKVAQSTAKKPEENIPSAKSKIPVLGDVPLLGYAFSERKPGNPAEPAKSTGRDASVAIDEVSALKSPFSTFSLHVSNVSFQLAAKAMLTQNQRPEPQSIRTEEFVNAFRYKDPVPAPGSKVGCTIEQAAHPFLPSRNLLRLAMATESSGRIANQPLRLTVLLDASGSMEREDRRAAMVGAVRALANLLSPNDQVTLIGFSRQSRLLADRLPGDQAKTRLPELVTQMVPEGGTNLEEALQLSEAAAQRQFVKGAQNRIVLITDGAANLGNARPEELAKRIEALRQKNIAFDACGVGINEVNDRMLEALTRNGDGRYCVLDGSEQSMRGFSSQLAGAFRPAAKNVKVQIRFNPARVSRYKLLGFDNYRLNKEDFHNDKVDAAELAREEAGVALYQVELRRGPITKAESAEVDDNSLLADDSHWTDGELGEVSVRYLDVATNTMVERTWRIPAGDKAPSFETAPASMQLAGTAALLAETLRGSPLGTMTPWENWKTILPKLRQAYPGDESVSQLLQMVEMLRK